MVDSVGVALGASGAEFVAVALGVDGEGDVSGVGSSGVVNDGG